MKIISIAMWSIIGVRTVAIRQGNTEAARNSDGARAWAVGYRRDLRLSMWSGVPGIRSNRCEDPHEQPIFVPGCDSREHMLPCLAQRSPSALSSVV